METTDTAGRSYPSNFRDNRPGGRDTGIVHLDEGTMETFRATVSMGAEMLPQSDPMWVESSQVEEKSHRQMPTLQAQGGDSDACT